MSANEVRFSFPVAAARYWQARECRAAPGHPRAPGANSRLPCGCRPASGRRMAAPAPCARAREFARWAARRIRVSPAPARPIATAWPLLPRRFAPGCPQSGFFHRISRETGSISGDCVAIRLERHRPRSRSARPKQPCSRASLSGPRPASLSSMIRRIEARISSIEGSRCALLACGIVTSAAPVIAAQSARAIRIIGQIVAEGMSLENPQTESVKDFNRLLCARPMERGRYASAAVRSLEAAPLVLDRVIMFLRPMNCDVQAEALGGQASRSPRRWRSWPPPRRAAR